MSSIGSLCEGLAAVGARAGLPVPLAALGVVLEEDAENALFVCANGLGVAAYRTTPTDFPADSRPGRAPSGAPVRLDLAANRDGFLERRFLLTGFDDALRSACAAQSALVIAIDGASAPAALVVGFADADFAAAAPALDLRHLADGVEELLARSDLPESRLDRLRRLELVDALLPTLFQVLDVREIFERLSAISQDVLRHDAMVLGLWSEDRQWIETYAQTSATRLPEINRNTWPIPQHEGWLCRLVDDVPGHPLERTSVWSATGVRSSIRVAVRLAGDVLGALNFSTRDPARYGANDLAIARHVGDYLALAMSHQRLADAARRAEELKLRAAQSDLLDELLEALTGAGELAEIFNRVSALAGKVIAHDSLLLAVPSPGEREARIYAAVASDGLAFPDTLPWPEARSRRTGGEPARLVALDPASDALDREAARRGHLTSLRAAVRLEGETVAELVFLSTAAAGFSERDLPAARRLADRLSVCLARERGRAEERRADEAASRAVELEARVRELSDELNARSGYHRVIGDSSRWREVLVQATRVGPTEATVLLLGESGTGKEVVARFLHRASARARGPFAAINCAALPDPLLEAELFGYERGAFTGATQSKAGQLELAAGGTLFLDEVAEMSLTAQAKLLRVLQEREFKRLGGPRTYKADVRIVAATNRDLEREMERERFREDLFYRLNVFSIRLPPLRERRDDLLALAQAFLADVSLTLGRPPAGLSQEAQRALVAYDWPGNVRELRNAMERAAILADGGLIVADHLVFRPARTAVSPAREPSTTAATGSESGFAGESGATLHSVERAMLERALAEARFNRSRAAALLGITRSQLYVRLRRHGLS
jgi:DNA-binding NtrC family response regulator